MKNFYSDQNSKINKINTHRELVGKLSCEVSLLDKGIQEVAVLKGTSRNQLNEKRKGNVVRHQLS